MTAAHPETTIVPRGSSITATISCAALTGLQFDRADIAELGYTAVRSRLRQALDPSTPGPQAPDERPAGPFESPALFGAVNERGVSSVSVPLLSQERSTTRSRVEAAVMAVSKGMPDVDLVVVGSSEDLYDFGVATLTVSIEIHMVRDFGSASIRQLSRRLRSELEAALDDTVRAMVADFQSAVNRAGVGESPPGSLMRERGIIGFADPIEAEQTEIGALLWIHTTFVVGVPDEQDVAATHRSLSALLPSFSVRVDLPGASVSPGLQVSVGVFGHDSETGGQSADALKQVMGDLNAWWTAVWHVDHLMFRFLSEVRSRRRVTSRRALEQQAQAIEELHDHVTLLQTLLDTFTLNLAGRERGIWDAGAQLWWLDKNMGALTTKMQALRSFHASIATELQTRASKRLEMLLAVFTVFGAVGSVAGVAQFVWPSPGDMGQAGRAAVMLTSSMAAMTFFLIVVVLRPRHRHRHRGLPSGADTVDSPVR